MFAESIDYIGQVVGFSSRGFRALGYNVSMLFTNIQKLSLQIEINNSQQKKNSLSLRIKSYKIKIYRI